VLARRLGNIARRYSYLNALSGVSDTPAPILVWTPMNDPVARVLDFSHTVPFCVSGVLAGVVVTGDVNDHL
jgi:hypothetical protein